MPQSCLVGDILNHGEITPEDTLYGRTIRSIHVLAVKQLSLTVINMLMELQFENGLTVSFDHISVGAPGEGGLTDWLQAGANVFHRVEREKAANTIMHVLFPHGVPLGLMGDGSNDRSLREQEAVVLRFIGRDGKPYNTFYDLAELDLKTSDDGHSPDSSCITACYSDSLAKLNQYEGFLLHSNWNKALVGGSFDGASVMLGSQNGVAAKLKAKAPHAIFLHAGAHVTQLAIGDAVGHVEYYSDWRATVQEVYVYYKLSGKKAFALAEVAEQLGLDMLTLKGSHGIRWAAADERAVKALLTDLAVIVADLEHTVKRDLGMLFDVLTASENFLKKKFSQVFEGKKWTATVASFMKGTTAAADKFILKYRDGKQLEMPKAELVSHLTNETDELLSDTRWMLRSKLLQFRFANFTAFMLDLYGAAAKLSCTLQGNSVTLFDVAKSVNQAAARLAALKSTPAANEAIFLGDCANDHGTDVYKVTCHLEDGDKGRSLVDADRKAMCDGLIEHFESRFSKVLDRPEIHAFAVFDHRKWPPLRPLEPMEAYGKPEISLLFDHFVVFFSDTTKEVVLSQWVDLKKEILDAEGLMLRKFNDLWSHMLVHFSDHYSFVLRLAVLLLLIPIDTSECERIFSLMNNIKTGERSKLNQANLRNLMLWHYHGKNYSLEKLPWLSILNEFKLLCPDKKRTKHKAFVRPVGLAPAPAPV